MKQLLWKITYKFTKKTYSQYQQVSSDQTAQTTTAPFVMFYNFKDFMYLYIRMFYLLLLLLFIHYLQLGRHPVAGIITCYISTDYEDFSLKFRYEGIHVKHVVTTGNCREPSQHLL